MNKIDFQIININRVICNNIEKFDSSERGLLSQNLISHLINFVEHISLKAYNNGHDIENSWSNIEKANAWLRSNGKIKFLSKFHILLQKVASHYTLGEENSERLMLKYTFVLYPFIRQYCIADIDFHIRRIRSFLGF